MVRHTVCCIPHATSVTKALVAVCLIGTFLIIYFDRKPVNGAGQSDNTVLFTADVPPSPKILARFQLNVSPNSTQNVFREVVDILFIFTKAKSRNLREKLAVFLTSLFEHSSAPLHLHVVTDDESQVVARQVLQDASARSSAHILVDMLHITDMLEPIRTMTEYMQEHFSAPWGHHYAEPLFCLSLGLHRVFQGSKRIILIDIDTRITSDIVQLHRHFTLFNDTTIMGIAYEQQPVYRHGLQEYRKRKPGTRCGEPPDRGFPGFNSGVLLLDLGRMRSSALYQELLLKERVENLTAKYSFKGILGDQDYYTLLGCEHPELFHVLPCTWNKQLCRYWYEHGYRDVFGDYQVCKGEVNIYHGNCNSAIPRER